MTVRTAEAPMALSVAAKRPRPLVVDQTHLGRHVTGVERVAIELFNRDAVAPHPLDRVTAHGLPKMVAAQQAAFLARGLADREALFMFPGFPPSPLSCLLGDRCLMYVHDTFPLTRRDDLGWKARAYIGPSFGWAVRTLRHFFVNSETTGRDLRRFCSPDALVALLRPPVRDVFGLSGGGPRARCDGPLRILAIGTIEPRKDYPAAIEIVRALNATGMPAELHIAGRLGWGSHPWLADPPGFLRLHGYLDDAALRTLVGESDMLISTSKAEGLGLPLLEVQHGGLPVIAPRGAVFDEVLAGSGLLIDPADPAAASSRRGRWPGPTSRAGTPPPRRMPRGFASSWHAAAPRTRTAPVGSSREHPVRGLQR